MKNVIPARQDLSLVLPEFNIFHFSWMEKFFDLRLYRKTKTASTRWKPVSPYQDENWLSHVIVGWNLPRLDGLKFHSGKTESCNYYLRKIFLKTEWEEVIPWYRSKIPSFKTNSQTNKKKKNSTVSFLKKLISTFRRIKNDLRFQFSEK